MPSPNRLPRVSRGQALVETAILLPILLILLLGAIDFGRAFFSWVSMHQAVRNGANYVSQNSDMSTAERAEFEALVEAELPDDCDPVPNPTFTRPDGTPTADPILGDLANLTVTCRFEPVTPLIGGLLGDPIAMSASATFPIRGGECINCPTPVPTSPPPPGIQCFAVPPMEGMSVAGARLAWQSAGFSLAKFVPGTGQDTETVESFTVTQDDPLSTCVLPTTAIFSSSVVVVTKTPTPPTGGCVTVPNLIGMTVSSARTAWEADFSGGFTADTTDTARVVTGQTTDPTSEPDGPGVACLDPATTSVSVTTGPAWPAPPPVPCRVPNMINLTRPDGAAAWVAAGFQAGNFSPQGGNWTILSQSLVGGTFVPCNASIKVSQNPEKP